MLYNSNLFVKPKEWPFFHQEEIVQLALLLSLSRKLLQPLFYCCGDGDVLLYKL